MPIDYRATTSLPGLGAAEMPASAIGQYVNQQVVPMTEQTASVEGSRNLYQQPITRESAQVAIPKSTNGLQSVSDIAQQNSISNQKLLNQTRQIQAKKKAEQDAANTAPASGVNGAYDYSNTGNANVGNLTGNRGKAIQLASSYLGNRYVMGGTSHQGIDCSGLVKVVYSQLGYNIPVHLASWQRDNIPGVRTNNINSLQPGDIVAWRDGSHIAVYAGNGYIIQAANPRQGVIKSLLTQQVGYTPNSVIGIKLQFPGE